MNTPAPPYRDATEEVASHARRLLADRREPNLDKIGRLYRYRIARISFGWVGSVAAVTALIVIAVARRGQLSVLGLAWAAALIGGLAGLVGARRKFKRMRERYESIGDDPYGLVLRLTQASDTDDEGPYELHRLAHLGLNSHRLPMLTGALLLPITSIAALMLLCGAHVGEIDEALRFALVYTLHVHLYGAIAAWRFPKKRGSAAMIGFAALFGLLPFIVSALVVAIVATLIYVAYFVPLSWWVDRESQWIDDEQQDRLANA